MSRPDWKYLIPMMLMFAAIVIISAVEVNRLTADNAALVKALEEAEQEAAVYEAVLRDAETRLSEAEYVLSVVVPGALGLDTSDVTVPSGLTVDGMRELVDDTGLAGTAYAFIVAEEHFGINAYVLYAIAAHESGFGTSRFAVERNNLTGHAAYTEDPDNAEQFATYGENIMETARNLRANYVDKGLKSLTEIGKRYADDPNWAARVGWIAREARGNSDS